METNKKLIVGFLNKHIKQFLILKKYANRTGHPVPSDSKYFSQILVTLLTGIRGIDRQKGADLSDNSDVKAALVWDAIDTPRFNGCIKAGTKSSSSDSMISLDEQPNLYLVLWDVVEDKNIPRCRVWSVNTQEDSVFREMCSKWYEKRANDEIKSTNFQLHPPRNKNSNIIRNTCGNLQYPLFFEAHYINDSYIIKKLDHQVVKYGRCNKVD